MRTDESWRECRKMLRLMAVWCYPSGWPSSMPCLAKSFCPGKTMPTGMTMMVTILRETFLYINLHAFGLQFTHNMTSDECSNIRGYHAGWYTCCVGSKLSKIKFFPHSLILTGFNGFAGGWCACRRPWCLHELGKKTLKGGGRKSWVPTARAITPTTPPPASSPAIHPDSNNLSSFNYMHWAVTYYMLHSYQVMQSRY